MNFGMRPYDGLDEKHFAFREVNNDAILSGTKDQPLKLYIGLTKWKDKAWKQPMGAENVNDKDMLEVYTRHFNAIELNASHYNNYTPEQVEKWTVKATDGFKFCPKMYQGVTHKGPLKNKEILTRAALNSYASFGEALGPVFIQLPPHYSPVLRDELFNYLMTLPKTYNYFLELRHSDWFTYTTQFQKDILALNQLGIGLVITDTPALRDVAHMHLSVPKTFIRFVCQGSDELDIIRIAKWKEQLAQWTLEGLQEAYFFLHVHEEEAAIDLAKFVQSQFNELTTL